MKKNCEMNPSSSIARITQYSHHNVCIWHQIIVLNFAIWKSMYLALFCFLFMKLAKLTKECAETLLTSVLCNLETYYSS
jgi:hypothetical protein